MITVLLLALLFIVTPPAFANTIDIEEGAKAPAFSLASMDGKIFRLSDHRGKVIVVIYWRPDQKRSSLAVVDGKDISDKYRDKGVEIVSIVPEIDDIKAVKKILRDKDIDFPVLIDRGRDFFSDYGVRVYPSTVIIDKEGKLAKYLPGHALTYKMTLDGNLRHILGEIDETQLQEAIHPRKKEKPQTEFVGERMYNLALFFTESGLIDQAIEAAKAAVKADPGIAKSHELLGFLYLEEEAADSAQVEFNRALEIEPTSHDARTGLGGAMILKGDIDGAIEVLLSAAQINPYPQMTYYELGRAYELKGEKDKALDMYKKSLDKIIKKQVLPSAVSQCQ
jgi:peroxiredoxin